jgi:hypothetical protein
VNGTESPVERFTIRVDAAGQEPSDEVGHVPVERGPSSSVTSHGDCIFGR